MKKDIKLWSISDYKDEALIEESSTALDFWTDRLELIELDPYKAFISLIDRVPTDYLENNKTLTGVPISIKDNICYSQFSTTCASKMLSEWVPKYDATVVSHLKSSGVLILGKTNLDEFAMGNMTGTSYFGKSFNPWDIYKRFSPGGSSGGSAISVTMGYSPVAIGSDTGGSIRCPASFCGVLGLKPTYGRVSRYGLVSYAHTLDQIGVFARYAQDLSKILEIISKKDSNDMTYKNKPFTCESLNLKRKLIVGVPYSSFDEVARDQKSILLESINLLEKKDFIEIKPIKIDDLDILLPTYYVIAFSEAYSNLVRYSGQNYGFNAGDTISTRLKGFGEEVQRRFNLGSFSLKTGFDEQLYTKSQKIRLFYRENFKKLFKSVDIIAMPTMLDVAFRWSEIQSPMDSYKADLLTVPSNLTGLPAISIPIGFINKDNVKFPVGLQLISSWWKEELLIQIAYEFQQLTNHHLKLPPEPIIRND